MERRGSLSRSNSTDDIHDGRHSLGICAMDKKAQSKPMQEILERLSQRNEFRIVVFGNAMILNEPIENWPICDALIAFFSTGFPFAKALEYANLRKPILVNDLAKQALLMDRRRVYETLTEHNIPLPRHVFVNRDRSHEIEQIVIEDEDYIEVDGEKIHKPFVEKPVDAEAHNINIYYPSSAGGGCKHLFRKIGNLSSAFHPDENKIRRDGSYIYEEFLSTQGTDVKVYTVGPTYAHAEARKSPVLDGKVMRDSHGKEVRYPVILSTEEKDMARRICKAFEQTVCGFDILRVQSKSVVCDVNGWSFVKNSSKYYDDCALILRKYLLNVLRSPTFSPVLEASISPSSPPSSLTSHATHAHDHRSDDHVYENSKTRSLSFDMDRYEKGLELDPDIDLGSYHHLVDLDLEKESSREQEEELRCVIAVIRHGDRTPKQKMKMKVHHPFFLDFYTQRTAGAPNKDLKIKSVHDLEKLLSVAKNLLVLDESKDPEFLDFISSMGIDREKWLKGIETLRDVLERWKLVGINRKVQLKPAEMNQDTGQVEKLNLILKWGGDLTHAGVCQAEALGQRFRHDFYPSGTGDGGLLRLHSTYRHDLKIYTSDEGRVQKTAAAFAKGFLELDGDLIPILVSLVVRNKDGNMMLEKSGTTVQKTILQVKKRLHDMIHRGDDCSKLKQISDSNLVRSVCALLDRIEQPIQKMGQILALMEKLKTTLEGMTTSESPCGRETLPMMAERWAKLHRDFYNKKERTYDLSKIPDIYDCIRYDAIHNVNFLKCVYATVAELLGLSETLADALVPQEYGIDQHEKIEIGTNMCKSLLKKIRDDLDLARGLELLSSDAGPQSTYQLDPTHARDTNIKSAHRSVRTRLYFTSESHLHTLLNVLRYTSHDDVLPSPIPTSAQDWLTDIKELAYMTSIVIRVFERDQYPLNDPRHYRVELMVSPGASGNPLTDLTRPLEVAPHRICSEYHQTCQDFRDYLNQAIDFTTRSRKSDDVVEHENKKL